MTKPHFIFLDVAESTNIVAKELINNKTAKNGIVIKANYQLSGRGRQENSWESAKNENLLFSIIVEPKAIHPSNQFIINEIVSVTLRDFIQSLLPPDLNVFIKWPNDIYVGQKKITGILIEHLIMGESIKWSIIGIGINVNQTSFQYAPNPTSLKSESCNSFSTEKLCAELSEKLLENMEIGIEHLSEKYNAHLFQKNEIHHYFIDDKEIMATIVGVAESGCLRLQFSDGSIADYELNRVKYCIN